MTKDFKQPDSLFDKLKRFISEQLWLILLLAPLLIVATFIGSQSSAQKKQIVIAGSSAFLAVSAEISSAEVAAIVAKPLSELLAMDVYFDAKQNSRNVTRVSTKAWTENNIDEADKNLLTNHPAGYLLVGDNYNNNSTDG
jgi:hypothetical protein